MNLQNQQADLAEETGLPIPRRYWSATAIWLALAMAVLDGAIANVALPTIAKEIGASAASSVWIVNAYQLTITVLLLPLAALGERLGYRRVYIPGLALFTLGSLACALAHGLGSLIAARVFQGIGAACIMSVNPALTVRTNTADLLASVKRVGLVAERNTSLRMLLSLGRLNSSPMTNIRNTTPNSAR